MAVSSLKIGLIAGQLRCVIQVYSYLWVYVSTFLVEYFMGLHYAHYIFGISELI